MKNVQLSTNFDLSEATFSKETNIRVEPDQGQIEYHKYLAQTCQVLFRDRLGSPVKIESGQRDRSIYLYLISAGYKPSSRSDHFFGSEINGWRWSTGAWDLSFPDAGDVFNIFTGAVEYLIEFPEIKDQIGQLIVYPEMGIIHISNSWKMVFSSEFCRFMERIRPNRKQFLICEKGVYTDYFHCQ